MEALKPTRGRVLIRRDKAGDKIGELYIAEKFQEQPDTGEIMAVGDATITDYGVEIPIASDIKPGARVLFAKYSGTEVMLNGEMLMLMAEKEVLATLETVPA